MSKPYKRLPPGSYWVIRFEVPSTTTPRLRYVVARNTKGNWGCDCLGWTTHVPRKDCRHIHKLKNELIDLVLKRKVINIKFFRMWGAKGGRKRNRLVTKEQMRMWGRQGGLAHIPARGRR